MCCYYFPLLTQSVSQNLKLESSPDAAGEYASRDMFNTVWPKNDLSQVQLHPRIQLTVVLLN